MVETSFLTPQQVAERLQVPLSWVYERTRRGLIPGQMQVGKYIRIREAEFLARITDLREAIR